jgi:nucleoside-diphosphate-sugar epimerase
MRYLITGGSGFIGTHLLRELIADQRTESIHVLDLNPPVIEDRRVHYAPWDIRDAHAPSALKGCDVCVHLAALCKEPGYEWDEYFVTNHEGTKRLCDVLDILEVRNVVFVSTMMVFRSGEQQMDEGCLTAPDTAYGISKLLAEGELRAWGLRGPGRRFRILRPGVVFGKGENGNFVRLYRALRKRRFAYVGRRTTIKGCIYVKDVVRCIRFLIDESSDRLIYNLVTPEATTIEAICESMTRAFGLPRYPIPTVPLGLARAVGYVGEFASALGIRNDFHHRRAEKLYSSTRLSVKALLDAGFMPAYDLSAGLADWLSECDPDELH